MSDVMDCPKCRETLTFLAGEPAHESNRYCPECEWQAWDRQQRPSASPYDPNPDAPNEWPGE